MTTFTAENISKEFNKKKLFDGVSFSLSQHSSLAITGKNGTGKSTLLKILCGLLSPTKGNWELVINENKIPSQECYKHIGLVSPYLNLYDEFSGAENLEYIGKMRGLSSDFQGNIDELLHNFALHKHRKKEVRYYSSGMKQRLKYCAALLHKPEILFLDEPQSNLDVDGIEVVRTYMKKQTETGILIFATNDSDDLGFAQTVLDLNTLKIEK